MYGSESKEFPVKNTSFRAMEDWQKRHIDKNLVELIKSTICTIHLISKLREQNILSRDDEESLDLPHLTPMNKSRQLYTVLQTREASYEILIQTLEETRQTAAARILKNHHPLFQNCKGITYDKNQILGTGCLGTKVFRGTFAGRDVAVKVLMLDLNDLTKVQQEIDFLKKLDSHGNIVRYFTTEATDSLIYIALELCLISLQDEVKAQMLKMPSTTILKKCTKGIAFLHSKNVIHRDLKPANVLLNENNQVKISDFGLSKQIPIGASRVSVGSGFVGTTDWVAPEVLLSTQTNLEQNQYLKMSTSSDIFSLGCIYFFVLTQGEHAFGGPLQRQYHIVTNQPMIINSGIEQVWLDLIVKMIDASPQIRPTAELILSSECFKPTKSVGTNFTRMSQLLNPNTSRAEIDNYSFKNPSAIGIDLGTTMCCVAVYYKGRVHVVPNRAQGNLRTTPSYVAFHEDGTDTFGLEAKEMAYRHPETTIYDAKRIIGRPWSDNMLQEDMKKWPFEVVNEGDNVKLKTWGKTRYPHEVSARLMTRFRIMAEDHINLPPGTIRKAVITVPAYFTEPQIRATCEAAQCSGLQVLSILNEPTAAAIAYSWKRRDTSGSRKTLIYDLGGGTFDVAIAIVTPNNVEILAVDGDTHLGGQDFDQMLMDYCLKEYKNTEGVDLEADRNSSLKTVRNSARIALSRVKIQCEMVKERLSVSTKQAVNVDYLYQSKNMFVTVTRDKMEELIKPLIQKTLEIVGKALDSVKGKGITGKEDVDDVILVGGSTKLALVDKMLTEYFGGRQLCRHINPDEVVAYGAAIQAVIMNNEENDLTVQK